LNPFPFTWGEPWKLCVEYKVSDYAAEVGFFSDVLGLPVYALNSDIAIFTSPEGDFFFSVASDQGSKAPSEPNSIRLQFMVSDILATVKEFEKRGIVFELPPQTHQSDPPLIISYFRTPNGVIVDLWGRAVSETTSSPSVNLAKNGGDDDSIDDGDEDDEESEEGDESLLGTDEDDLSEDEDEADEMLIAEEEVEAEDESGDLIEFEDDIEEDEDELDFEFEEEDEFEDDEED
jgi:catechol 2,3-dioxygenase-like lactoylglutathione lyase family enzyme